MKGVRGFPGGAMHRKLEGCVWERNEFLFEGGLKGEELKKGGLILDHKQVDGVGERPQGVWGRWRRGEVGFYGISFPGRERGGGGKG